MKRIGRNPKAIPVSRQVVESLAKIIGPFSAVAQALRRADAIDLTAKFWSNGKSIIVMDGDPS